MMFLLVILLGMFLRGIKNGKHLLALKYPLFCKEGRGGDLTTATYLKLISLIPFCKRGFFNFIRNIFKG